MSRQSSNNGTVISLLYKDLSTLKKLSYHRYFTSVKTQSNSKAHKHFEKSYKLGILELIKCRKFLKLKVSLPLFEFYSVNT